MKCRVCQSLSREIFTGRYLENYDAVICECASCGYVQVDAPTWLKEAYSSAINYCDTGIMARNQGNVGLTLATLSALKLMSGTVVDYAGGYGILVRLLRDRGINAVWSDPYCENLLAVGFEYTGEKSDLVTAFEVFEHFVDPLLEIERLFSIAPNLLVSTSLIGTPAPQPDQWWYYGLDHGQHIGFFRLETLDFIAKKFNKYVVTDGVDRHLFTDKPVNSIEWIFKTRVARRMPFLFGRELKSKIWTDFTKMSARS